MPSPELLSSVGEGVEVSGLSVGVGVGVAVGVRVGVAVGVGVVKSSFFITSTVHPKGASPPLENMNRHRKPESNAVKVAYAS